DDVDAAEYVSIRARAKRATFQRRRVERLARFQSAPARSGRHEVAPPAAATFGFQSAPARSGRPCSTATAASARWFQSAPARSGRLDPPAASAGVPLVSIRARAKRATRP